MTHLWRVIVSGGGGGGGGGSGGGGGGWRSGRWLVVSGVAGGKKVTRSDATSHPPPPFPPPSLPLLPSSAAPSPVQSGGAWGPLGASPSLVSQSVGRLVGWLPRRRFRCQNSVCVCTCVCVCFPWDRYKCFFYFFVGCHLLLDIRRLIGVASDPQHLSVAPLHRRQCLGSPAPLTCPSSFLTRPSSFLTRPSTSLTRPPSSLTRPPSSLTSPPSPLTPPSSPLTHPPSSLTHPPSPLTRPPSPLTRRPPSVCHQCFGSTLPPDPLNDPLLVSEGATVYYYVFASFSCDNQQA
ncbi:hypothetical protein Pmani_037191 [Petrolisthes manimaculis]|uniref:Uncharacterized protein n=1 Tax=Petrolisthes manimaculis TaxID=1843537 RepID=A0AAE1TNK1_9EUCA|nr:hypothetical protein Pmani_037191 [Petrolisthes manimaculis]